MEFITQPSEAKKHIRTALENSLIFNANAEEIQVLDRWGKRVWHKERGASLEAIRWNGIDLFGQQVTTGSYTCKIVYPDQMVVYVPFIFIQK